MEAKKLSNGNWQVRFRDLSRVQRAKNFKTKKAADAFITSLKYELEEGSWLDPKSGRVLLEDVWANLHELKTSKKRSTQAEYESLWNVHIGPKWGKTPISRITQSDFDKWVISRKLSASRTRKLHLLGSMLFDLAVRDKRIKANPLKDATGKRDKSNLPVVPVKIAGNALTLEELLLLASNCGKYEDYVLMMGLCGMRWGEFVGLEVRDLDIEQGLIRVQRTYAEINGKLYLETPKNHQERVVFLVDLLLERAPKWVEGKNPTDPLFASPEGKVLRNTNFARRVMAPALKKSELKHIRIHDLRWTAISFAASIGIDPRIVQRQMGHSNVHMTNAYTQIFTADRRNAVLKASNAISEVHKKCTPDENEGIAKLEKVANSASEQAKFGLQTLENWLRQENYESAALTG